MLVSKRPFGCGICDMSFTLAKALKEHVEKTHFKEQTENITKYQVNKLHKNTLNDESSSLIEKLHKSTETDESVNLIEQTEYILEPGTFLELKSQSDIESEADEEVSKDLRTKYVCKICKKHYAGKHDDSCGIS